LSSVIIFNNLGVEVQKYKGLENTKTTITLNDLKSGQYVIEVNTKSNNRYINKIVIL